VTVHPEVVCPLIVAELVVCPVTVLVCPVTVLVCPVTVLVCPVTVLVSLVAAPVHPLVVDIGHQKSVG